MIIFVRDVEGLREFYATVSWFWWGDVGLGLFRLRVLSLNYLILKIKRNELMDNEK